MSSPIRLLGILACSVSMSVGLLAQSANLSGSTDAASPAAPAPSPVAAPSSSGMSDRIGVGVKVSFLGAGIEAATRVTQKTNFRAGFNMFSYSRGFGKDGVSYNGSLDFKTVEGHFDIFPFGGGFRVSPGFLAYIGDPITASAAVPGGKQFSLGGTQYISDPTVPVTGRGKINFNSAAPTVTFGWGNLVSRKEGKHFSVPVELGVAFQGSPKATLGLAGNVCDTTGTNCRSVSDPTVQANIVSEQTKVNNSMSFFKVYPIISVGFGYKF
ncbi:MAG TPA: hypothetical protein VFO39_13750 [Candidatus Sulfotelmatobacter sp.]|nr:hypothetical protein [Candidatus Sulfotelmatobacter sp.]